MKARREFSLKKVAAIHNMILCIWSLIMFVGIVHAMVMLVLVYFFLRFVTERTPDGTAFIVEVRKLSLDFITTGFSFITSANFMNYSILLS